MNTNNHYLCCSQYDSDGDGHLSFDDLHAALQSIIGQSPLVTCEQDIQGIWDTLSAPGRPLPNVMEAADLLTMAEKELLYPDTTDMSDYVSASLQRVLLDSESSDNLSECSLQERHPGGAHVGANMVTEGARTCAGCTDLSESMKEALSHTRQGDGCRSARHDTIATDCAMRDPPCVGGSSEQGLRADGTDDVDVDFHDAHADDDLVAFMEHDDDEFQQLLQPGCDWVSASPPLGNLSPDTACGGTHHSSQSDAAAAHRPPNTNSNNNEYARHRASTQSEHRCSATGQEEARHDARDSHSSPHDESVAASPDAAYLVRLSRDLRDMEDFLSAAADNMAVAAEAHGSENGAHARAGVHAHGGSCSHTQARSAVYSDIRRDGTDACTHKTDRVSVCLGKETRSKDQYSTRQTDTTAGLGAARSSRIADMDNTDSGDPRASAHTVCRSSASMERRYAYAHDGVEGTACGASGRKDSGTDKTDSFERTPSPASVPVPMDLSPWHTHMGHGVSSAGELQQAAPGAGSGSGSGAAGAHADTQIQADKYRRFVLAKPQVPIFYGARIVIWCSCVMLCVCVCVCVCV
jgi:hypothetical protein